MTLNWLRRILGIEQIPAPDVGQVYVSGNNGQKIKIAEVLKSMCGHISISVFYWSDSRSGQHGPACGSGIADAFVFGLDDWRRKARAYALNPVGMDGP